MGEGGEEEGESEHGCFMIAMRRMAVWSKMAVMSNTVKIDKSGRILIPLKLRKELGFKVGSELILRVEEGELRVHTREAALRWAREQLKKLKKPGESVVDEFLAERREEARREVMEMDQ